MNVNYSIPVKMFDFKEDKNSLYSTAKLKIFYVGTTGDKRTFTQEFSDNLLKTLPYVPVVGYYNKDNEDFEGHKLEVQYIYGIIPESAVVEYVEEDSKKYAVSDVILYTGRTDETGEVAKRIVGKSHSLELNPSDTKYKVNRDSEGNFVDLEFTEGSLLGLSVLGDDEKPAFSGSEFFKETEDIEEIFKNLKEFVNKKRGENMRLEKFKEFSQFIKKSYDEQYTEIGGALEAIFGELHYVDQMFDNHVIVYYLDENWEEKVVRVNYEVSEGSYVFETPVKVVKRYFTEDELENMSFIETEVEEAAEEAAEEMTEEVAEEMVEETVEEVAEEVEVEKPSFEESDESEGEEVKPEDGAAEIVENAEEVEAEEEETEEPLTEGEQFDEEHENNEEDEEDDTSTFTESEREELEALREEVETYRRRDRKELIDSFEGHLPKAFLEDLMNRVSEFTLEELDTILSKEFTKIKKENEPKNNTFVPFSNKTNVSTQEDYAERMRRLVGQLK